uniref:MD-2-related lipid-recognition domain-containing protein n=1 Tax=Strigamia maritima TaxID=126957 RepID=T1JAP6_STRMM
MNSFYCLALFLAVANAKIYTDCSTKPLSEITSIDVQDCTATPCVLKRGGKTELKINFNSLTSSTKLTTKVYGVIGGIKIPWTGLPANACGSVSCPLTSGNSYEYKNSIAVLPSYPAIKVDVQFEFKADNGDNVLCFKIPVQLQ